jgi:hypothetical protein
MRRTLLLGDRVTKKAAGGNCFYMACFYIAPNGVTLRDLHEPLAIEDHPAVQELMRSFLRKAAINSGDHRPVLVVEADPDARSILRSTLEKDGFTFVAPVIVLIARI